MKRQPKHPSAMTRILAITMVSAVILAALAGSSQAAQRQFVRFGGSNPGGSWFTIVGGLSAFLSEQCDDLNVTSIATGGSVDNNRLARKQELDTWLTHSLTAHDNWTGTGLFKAEGPYQEMRLLCGVYENHHHFVVLDKSAIRTMSDLKGKKVCVGSAGSGGAINSQNILTALGIWDQVTPQHLTWSAGGRGLTDGQIDCMGASSAPLPAIVTAEAMHKIRLVELSDQEFETVLAKFPAYKKSKIPKGVYKSMPADSPCIAFQVYWAAQKDADAEAVYKMMKAAFDPKNREAVHGIHRHLKSLSDAFDGMKTMGIPLHKGAVRFWKEQGMSVPTELVPPEA